MVLQKEYRIVLPVSVEEYSCAQVYMTSRTSLAEAMDQDGAGVEILANRPAEHRTLGPCQYTKKVFHIDKRFPSWLRMIAPKSGSYLLEESWNAYPSTITEVTFPMFSSFRILVESHHLPDRGDSNPHGLDKAARKNCEIVRIDIAERRGPDDQSKSQHGPGETDLQTFRSKCGRGPFLQNWQQEVKPVMCAYKKVTCEVQVWGMAAKVENFMQAYELDLFHKANKNTICWMDEWHGLTMHELRLFEADAQLRINLISRIKQVPSCVPVCVLSFSREGGARTSVSGSEHEPPQAHELADVRSVRSVHLAALLLAQFRRS